MLRIAVIGSVSSTSIVIKSLIKHKANLVSVFGYEPKDITNISGYENFSNLCHKNNIDYYGFDNNINEIDNIVKLKSLNLDILFVIGFSQLIKSDILNLPKLGVIGFHPTPLPFGRGRAPMAWMIIEEYKKGAASFFQIDEGTDSGPLFIQEYYSIDKNDNVNSLQKKLFNAMKVALDNWLPNLLKGLWGPVPQNNFLATYYGKRTPLDGLIEWNLNSENIITLIKATGHPHPGAYTFYSNYKIIIWEAENYNCNIKGVLGRIIDMVDNNPIVQTGKGHIIIKKYEVYDYDGYICKKKIKTGTRLGYYEQNEIFKLKNEIFKLKNEIFKLRS